MTLLPPYSTSFYRWMAVLWTAGIVVGISLPASSLSPMSPILSADKLVHFALFFVFGALWMRVLCPPDEAGARSCLRRGILRLFVLGGLFAGGSELYQQVIPIRRMMDPYDAVANGAGLLVGMGLYTALVYRRDRGTGVSDG